MSPHSYLYLNGCTNYGGNIAVAIESSSCSSEATGRGSGIAGLLDLGGARPRRRRQLTPRRIDPTGAVHPLSADEVRAAPHHDRRRHRLQQRNRAVVVHALALRHPVPALRLAARAGTSTSATAAPTRTAQCWRSRRRRGTAGGRSPRARLVGDARSRAHPGRRRSWAPPRPRRARPATAGSWPSAAACSRPRTASRRSRRASGLTAPLGPGTLAHVVDRRHGDALRDRSSTASRTTAPSGTPSPDDTPDMFTVTLRLRVTDDAGRRGESRRTVYLHHDPDLLPRLPARDRRQRRAVAALRHACAARRRAADSRTRPPAAPRADDRRHHPRPARRRPSAARLAGAHRPAAAAHRLARVHERRAADDVLRVARRRRSPRPTSTATAHGGRGGLSRRQALRLGARRHAPARVPGADRAALLGPQRARPLQPAAARVSSRRPCSPTSTATAHSRSSPPQWTATSTSGTRTAARRRAGRCWWSIARRWRRSTR